MDAPAQWNSGFIFERKAVIKSYFKSWFIIDFVSIMPYSFFNINHYPKIYLILMSLKLSRLRKTHTGLKKLLRKLGFGVVTIRFTISVWNLLLMLHLTACLWGTIGEVNMV